MTFKRGRERTTGGYGEEISVRQQKQPGFVCFIWVFEDSRVHRGSAKGGRGADILTTMRDFHTSLRNV